MLSVLIGAILGALTSIATAISVEYLRRPSLELLVETPPLDLNYQPNMPAKTGRALRVKLFNKPMPRWATWMVRDSAVQCRATIGFYHMDGRSVFNRDMPGRWSSSPEPVPMQGVDTQGNPIFRILDFTRLTLTSHIDVYPGEHEPLDIALRPDADIECYGWNNEAYFVSPLWRNPNWKLGKGRYLVKVLIISSGQKCAGFFRLINDGSRDDFRLEPATKGEFSVIID